MVDHPIDDPVGGRGAGGDADPAVGLDIDCGEFFGGLDVEGGFPLEFRELRKAPGVGAVPAADDEDGVGSGGERLDLGLALLGGIADRLEDDRLGEPLPDAADDRRVLLHALRRLGDDAHPSRVGEAATSSGDADDDPCLAGKAQQAVHLRVLAVPGDQDRVIPRTHVSG